MDRSKFIHAQEDSVETREAKDRELGRRHALEDSINSEKRPHSIDAGKHYLSSYEKHHSGLKEHQHPYWEGKK